METAKANRSDVQVGFRTSFLRGVKVLGRKAVSPLGRRVTMLGVVAASFIAGIAFIAANGPYPSASVGAAGMAISLGPASLWVLAESAAGIARLGRHSLGSSEIH